MSFETLAFVSLLSFARATCDLSGQLSETVG